MDYYSSLKSQLDYDLDCHFFDSIDSTNSFLANSSYETKTQLCVAREQTKGQGQHGRNWVSEKDGSIIFSIRQCFNEQVNVSGLSLVVGMAIIKSIRDLNVICLVLKLNGPMIYTLKTKSWQAF